MQVTGCRLLFAGCRLQVAVCCLLVAGGGCWLHVSGCGWRLLVAGFRFQVAGCRGRLQVAVCWLQVEVAGGGCWLQVLGCWLQVAGWNYIFILQADASLEGIVYIFYLVGKCLGVKDEFNLCHGGARLAKQRCSQILHQVRGLNLVIFR